MSRVDDHWARLKAAIEANLPVPNDVRAWFLEGAGSFDDSGGRRPLCICLGLRGRGRASAEERRRLAERNQWLREAWNLVSCETITQSERAARLIEAAHRFETCTWPRIRHLENPPARLSEFQSAIFRALKTGAKLPGSRQSILSICK